MDADPRALPRLIACDLDGTFLLPDGTVSELNARAVAAAEEAGIGVVFATGRPVRWLGVLADLPCAERRVICSNGALLFDLSTQTPLASQPIACEVALEAVRLLRREVPGVAFGAERGLDFGTEAGYLRNASDHQAERSMIAPVEELVAPGDVIKLLVQHRGLTSEDLAHRAERVLGETVTVTHSSFGGPGLLEVSAVGVSKASTLARYCHGRGVEAADVAAFGDMPNDAAMLAYVGRPHLMANAHESLADLEAVRIGSNAESAVGRTILAWLAGSSAVDSASRPAGDAAAGR